MIRASNHDSSFRTTFTNGDSSSIADMPTAKGGEGQGFGPHDLLEAALATCMAITARKYAGDHQLPLGSAHCEVQIDRSIVGAVTLDYRLSLEGRLTPSQEQNIRDAVSRCPVAQTLNGAIALRSLD